MSSVVGDPRVRLPGDRGQPGGGQALDGEASPLRLSWTRLRLHSECRAKGDLLARFGRPPVTDIRTFFAGTVADRCMRRWLEQEEPQPGQMEAWVPEMFREEEQKARESGDGRLPWRAGEKAEKLAFTLECVRRLELLLQRVCLPYGWQPAKRFEVPLEIPGLDGSPRVIHLAGEFDLLTEPPFGVVVWDLKATRDDQYWRKTKGQLVFYSIAVAADRGAFPAAAGLLQPMCEQQDPTWLLDQEDYAQMFARIVATAHDIWAGRLDPKADNAGCSYCPVRGRCPKMPKGRGRVVSRL